MGYGMKIFIQGNYFPPQTVVGAYQAKKKKKNWTEVLSLRD